MKILSIKTLAGRNIYSHKPIIKILLDLEELHDKTTLEFDHFNDALLQLFPDLIKHHCGLGKHGGFVERISQGTYFGHVVEHVVLELQVLLGYEVFFGKTRIKKEPGIYNLIIEYANEHVAIECVKQAIYIVESMIKNKDVDYYNIMQDLEEIRDKHMLGPSAKAIFDEAKRRKIPVRRLGNESILELGYGKYSRLTQAALTDSTSNIAIEISCNKELTKQLLMENIIPTPSGGVANSVEDAIEIAHDIGFPVVLKPLDGNQGKGVVLNVNSSLELQNLFEIPLYYSNNVMVERHIRGND